MGERDDRITCQRVILCEGSQDAAFFEHLIRERRLPDFQVTYPTQIVSSEPGGKSGFTNRLRALRSLRDFDNITDLLIFADNDDRPTERFKETCEAIKQAGKYQIPNAPTKLTDGKPRVAIYMLPKENVRGQLETLCLESCTAAWPHLANCMESFVNCNPDLQSWDNGKKEKMKLRVMIASICAQDPNTALTHAWSRTQKIIPLDHECFNAVSDFLLSVSASGNLPLIGK